MVIRHLRTNVQVLLHHTGAGKLRVRQAVDMSRDETVACTVCRAGGWIGGAAHSACSVLSRVDSTQAEILATRRRRDLGRHLRLPPRTADSDSRGWLVHIMGGGKGRAGTFLKRTGW